MFFKKKSTIDIGDEIVFVEDLNIGDMFGESGIIKKGTIGIISDKNVTTTVYDIKYIKNYEVRYGNKQRVLIPANTKAIRKSSEGEI